MALNKQAKKLWAEIRNPNCTDCVLHEEAQTVCLIGDGPVPTDVMVIGEAPGYREDELHKPFAGRSGQLLDSVLEKAGLPRRSVFITNAAKCRPPDNRTPGKIELKACRPYLDDELKAVKPSYVLLLGNTALGVVKKSGIMKQRGNVFDLNGAKAFATMHPAAVLRNPNLERVFEADVLTFARLVRGEEAKIKPPQTIMVQSKKGLERLVHAILSSEALAYDVETAGRDEFTFPARQERIDWVRDSMIATISVATEPGLAFGVPLYHPEAHWKRPGDVLRIIATALAYTNAKRVAHNAKFDDRWLSKFGVPLDADFDTMIAAHLLDENRLKGLKPLAQVLLGTNPWKDVDLGQRGSLTTDLRKLIRYNAKDADYTLRLYYLFREELLRPENSRTLRLFLKLMMPAARALKRIEQHGMWVDKQRLIDRTVEVERRSKKTLGKVYDLAGRPINVNSPQQLSQLLFSDLGLPIVERTPKGAPSTKESVLLRLRHEHPICNLIIEARTHLKNLGTYLYNYQQLCDEEDRVHGNYKVTGTVTGRLSSGKRDDTPKEPGLNMQQVPRDIFIRGIFGAPPGWRFVEADFSQIELRIAAHIANERNLLRIFRDGRDPHMEMAMRLTGKPAHLVTKEERKKSKGVNFGYLYGMGAAKYVEYARDSYDLQVTMEEAEDSRDEFFRAYPALRPWHERQRRLVRQYKRVQSPIGRVRHLPDVDSPDKMVQGEAERQAINSPVQSLASDMMLLSMTIFDRLMPDDEGFMVGTVHDALLFEIREDKVRKWVPVIRQVMDNLPLKKKFGVVLDVPILVDISVGTHWGEGESWPRND
jgi:uracil-DNA glycosylase family 4